MRISLSAKAAKGVGFEDLGMEATYEFEVRDMPVTVVVDSSGTSVHQTGPREWQGRGRWSTSWPCRAAAMASSNPCCGASSRRWLPKPRARRRSELLSNSGAKGNAASPQHRPPDAPAGRSGRQIAARIAARRTTMLWVQLKQRWSRARPIWQRDTGLAPAPALAQLRHADLPRRWPTHTV
jgi:hypothetical protein